MAEPTPLREERELLRELARLTSTRGQHEPALLLGRREQQEAAEAEFQQATKQAQERLQTELAAAEKEEAAAKEAIQATFAAEEIAADKEFRTVRAGILREYRLHKDEAKANFTESRWTMGALMEARKAAAEKLLREQEADLQVFKGKIEELRYQAIDQLERWKQPASYLDPSPPTSGKPRKIGTYLAIAEKKLAQIRDLRAPRYLQGGRLFSLSMILGLALVYPLGWLLRRFLKLSAPMALETSGIIAGAVVAIFFGVISYFVLAAAARRQLRALGGPLGRALIRADERCQEILQEFIDRCRRSIRRGKGRYARDLKAALAKAKQYLADIKKKRKEEMPRIKEAFRLRCETNEKRRFSTLRTATDHFAKKRADSQKRFETLTQGHHQARELRMHGIASGSEGEWKTLAVRWREGMAKLKTAVANLNTLGERSTPPWSSASWANWSTPANLPDIMRFGQFEVRLADFAGGMPDDNVLRAVTPESVTLPALRGFPDQCSMLFQAEGEGREKAVAAVRAVMFRLLTSVPAGKLRFTILDPAGLGQNFAAFMDLADHDDALVGARIWTEAGHIEQRLGDLTAHLENVIQKYLRDRFATIMDYNAQAEEVAEPFRVVVAANFPTHFSDEAARRLVRIARNGARCGVFTLVTVDRKQPLPAGFDMADLEAAAIVLDWRDGRFVWKDADFGPWVLSLDTPPPEDLGQRLLERVGKAALEASKVEVPFSFVVPPEETWWKSSSRGGLSVALGKAGAFKRQLLELGKGTSQHVLVAGKTGSGKSSLLHALVTNLSLHYSPDEVELYLIDFKKGVEFKAYATNELAHARVVAIESEREFGLSVLQRLDAELGRRGELFRTAGVQDLPGYRDAGHVLPRILLVVDEFQEFFIEDDRLAREASQVLDRLVRQGRAFGLHIILGSQTLGGAYSLARSTIDQMAVRIALQLSEADAHLTLSADNGAARLLSRPGEAIYNDANGLVEGNNPFQVVWLPDGEREEYLRKIKARAGRRPGPTVFEGNAPATIGGNGHLAAWLHGGKLPVGNPRVWLGEAMALTDHTAAFFPRHNGSNLVLIGQNEETAQGMFAVGLVSLAAEEQVQRCYLIDGMQGELNRAGPWAGLINALGPRLHVGGWRHAASLVNELAEELKRRETASATEEPPIFFAIHGLHRCRDLRRPEDDFGFNPRGDAAPSPPQQLATLLREGPAYGMHALIWCDTLANLQRTLDRHALRELSLRVALQMNVGDSTTLLDSPLASKLGAHRAILFNEEDGKMEKFRPYGLPDAEWWQRALARLQG